MSAITRRKREQARRPDGLTSFNRDSPQAVNLIGWWPFDASTNRLIAYHRGNNVNGTLTSTRIGPAGTFGGYAGVFNGTSSAGSIAFNLSAYTAITVSLWFNGATFPGGIVFEYTADFNSNAGGFFFATDAGDVEFGIAKGDATNYWTDHFALPNANEWHHYIFSMNRATPVNLAWLDGRAQTLTATDHIGSGFGSYANSTLYLMSRATTSIYQDGQIMDLRIYSGAFNDALADHIYNPATRWDLYARPSRRIMVTSASAAFDPSTGYPWPEPDQPWRVAPKVESY